MPPNHPNRSKKPGPGKTPKPAEIRAAREAAALTQTQAGELVHANLRSWQQWEAGDRRMHPAFWELFQLKLEPPGE